MQGGGGPLLTGTIEESKAYNCHSELVSESVPRYEQVSNIGQIPKSSCSTREKRHREKCGFRFVPPLARAIRDDTG